MSLNDGSHAAAICVVELSETLNIGLLSRTSLGNLVCFRHLLVTPDVDSAVLEL